MTASSRRLARLPRAQRGTRLAAFATLSLGAVAAAAAAQQATDRLDPVVVTAARLPQRLSEVLADLTVITRDDIERQSFGGLPDLLRAHGGVELVRSGGPGANASLFLRGADTRHTVLLVDGVRVDSQATGGASWHAIPLAQIERVEVLKGPASAIYGSDAVGGVVQVFTRKGAGRTQFELGAGVGSLGTSKLDGSVGGASGAFDYSLSLAGERSRGFNAVVDPNSWSYVPDRDGWRSRNASARLGLQLERGHRLELTTLKSHVDAQYDASSFAPSADDHGVQDTTATRLAWNAQWQPGLQTQASWGESREQYTTSPYPYDTRTRIRSLALQGSLKLDAQQQLNALLERREDRMDNSELTPAGTPGSDARRQNALALGWLWASGPLSLQAHGRHDDDSQFGGVNTGTLAAGYQIAPAWRLIGSAGTAFRAPTLYQRASVYGPDLGKPGVKALDAEHGRNSEFGLKYRQAGAQGVDELSLIAYRNEVSDLIIFGAAGSCQSEYGCYANVSKARLQGLSLKGSTQAGGIQWSGALDLQSPKDASTGHLLARRARQHASLRADWATGGWTLGAQALVSGQRFDDAANSRRLGGYALLNLDAQRRLGKELSLQLNLDNAFNRVYQTAGGFAQAPRTWFVGLRYTPSL